VKITNIETAPGHWLMAKMGKRVLRPGGVGLTRKLIEALAIKQDDEIVEFAPGLGVTAALAWQAKPQSWTGIELDGLAAERLRAKLRKPEHKVVQANASGSGLPEASADKVYGEAMLTMQGEKQKTAIIQEAFRLLKPGGYYGVHEIALSPEDLSGERQAAIQKDLIDNIKVNARPKTLKAWISLFESAGFEVVKTEQSPMHLLEPKRLIQDEGLLRVLLIGLNMLFHPRIAKRIRGIRAAFRKHQKHMRAFVLIVKKSSKSPNQETPSQYELGKTQPQ